MTKPKPRNWGRAPTFVHNDELYNMSVPESDLNIVKIRELRAAEIKLLEDLRSKGYLREDSPAIEQINEAWKTIYNEYSTIYQANAEDDERINLFGKNRMLSPGEKITDVFGMKKLMLGDRVETYQNNRKTGTYQVMGFRSEYLILDQISPKYAEGYSGFFKDFASSVYWIYIGNVEDGLSN